VQQWTKLVLGYKDVVPGSAMSYKDLNAALPEMLKGLPDTVEATVEEPEPPQSPPKEEAPVEPEEPEKPVEEEANEAAADFAAGFDAFESSDEDDDEKKPLVAAPTPALTDDPAIVEHKLEEEK